MRKSVERKLVIGITNLDLLIKDNTFIMTRKNLLYFLSSTIIFLCAACSDNSNEYANATMVDTAVTEDGLQKSLSIDATLDETDSLAARAARGVKNLEPLQPGEAIDTRNVNPEDVIRYAETLVGTPYVYGSTDPKVGFDCSGFITYVFTNFKIKVPRSSPQFSNVGKTVPVEKAKRGDIVLFTNPGLDNTVTNEIGHMGLITANTNGQISFIHSTSGKAMSVAVSPLSTHYMKRFVRVSRIFPQNDL